MIKKVLSAALVFAAAAVLALTGTGKASALIGGDSATEEYRFLATMQWADGRPQPHRCGGTLVAPQWVVTAAHCIAELDGALLDPADFVFKVGSNNINGGAKFTATKFAVHPFWGTDNESEGDIGLVKLDRSSEETPIDNILHPAGDDSLRIVGWGRTVEDDPNSIPDEVLQLDSKLLNFVDCKFGDEFAITPGDVCVELPKNGTAGPCNGDSGSPLLWKVNGVWRIVGVDSRGGGESGCLNTPEVYTTTDAYWDWVQETINTPGDHT